MNRSYINPSSPFTTQALNHKTTPTLTNPSLRLGPTVIQQPRVLFDAFQDVTRTGPLPAALREGSMPLYFSLNRKYLSQYDYMQSHGPDGLGKRFKNLGKTQGAIHRELLEKGHAARPATEDELLGQAELTMGRKLLARPTTSLGLTGGGCRMRVLPDELVHCGDATSFPVWQVMRSETKGFPYWYNRVTGESRWTPPGDNLEIINSQNHLVMPEDRSWYTYQTGYYGGRPDLSSVGMTTSQMASLQIKPEYVVDHLRGHRKTLQRRLAAPDEVGPTCLDLVPAISLFICMPLFLCSIAFHWLPSDKSPTRMQRRICCVQWVRISNTTLLPPCSLSCHLLLRRGAALQAMGAQPGVSYTRDEMDGVSDYPEKFNAMQNGASWEGKLLRLIVQKCEEHSGRHVSMVGALPRFFLRVLLGNRQVCLSFGAFVLGFVGRACTKR